MQHIEAVEQHDVHGHIKAVISLLGQLEDQALQSTVQWSDLQRLSQVMTHVQRVLSVVDPALVPIPVLNNVSSDVTGKLLPSLRSYASRRDASKLTEANRHADEILMRLAPLYILADGGRVGNVRTDIGNFRRSMTQLLLALERQVGSIEQAIESTKNEIESTQAKFQRTYKAQEEHLSQITSAYETAFSNEQAKRTQEFSKFTKDSRSEMEAEIRQFQAKWQESLDNAVQEFRQIKEGVEEQATELRSSLEEHLQDAKRIVGIISNVGVSGNFQKDADQERRQANMWRGIALLCYVSLPILTLCWLHWIASQDLDWQSALLRLFLTLGVLVPGQYAASEAAKHRRREEVNRRLELELASIDSYLASLPESERNQVKQTLAHRYFGGTYWGVQTTGSPARVKRDPKIRSAEDPSPKNA